MKSKFFSIIVVVAFVSLSGYGVYKNQQKNVLSDVMLANLEALADIEGGDSTLKLDCWSDLSSNNGNVLPTHVTYCLTCEPILARGWSKNGICVHRGN